MSDEEKKSEKLSSRQRARIKVLLSTDAREILDRWKPQARLIMIFGMLGPRRMIEAKLFTEEEVDLLLTDSVVLLTSMLGQETLSSEDLPEGMKLE